MARDAVERLSFYVALGGIEIGLDNRIARDAGDRDRGVERAGGQCRSAAGHRDQLGERRAVNRGVAEDIAAVTRFPIAQRHGYRKLRAYAATAERRMIEPHVIRRGGDRGIERIERVVRISESARPHTALDLRTIQAADRFAIEHRRTAVELHRKRRGALAQSRQQLAEVARLQVDAQLAAGGAGECNARVRQAEPRMPEIENLARRIPIRGNFAFDRRARRRRPDFERGNQMQCPRVVERAFHLQRAAGRAVPG
jgi:hypothetical protein